MVTERAIKVASKARASSLVLLLAVMLMGCSGDYMHSYQSVGGAWSKCDTLSFPANWYRNVGGQPLDIYLGVRYTTAYPYKNLCVQPTTAYSLAIPSAVIFMMMQAIAMALLQERFTRLNFFSAPCLCRIVAVSACST